MPLPLRTRVRRPSLLLATPKRWALERFLCCIKNCFVCSACLFGRSKFSLEVF